jgi:outer membrane protein OmpA-like peptidoglycan-associated protein
VLLAAGAPSLLALFGCGTSHPVETPVEWWHHLQGGAIAQSRPPPPGADLPYPRVFSIPKKPTIPSSAFRQTVQTELTQDRDNTERLVARTPIDLSVVPAPPPPKPAAAPASSVPPPEDTANATLPAADPLPPPAPSPAGGPAPGPQVIMIGTPPDESGLPTIPDSPPPPPTFESVAAQPAPTPPPPLPTSAPLAPDTTRVLFATGDATLAPSQKDSLGDVADHRGKTGSIAIEGHGEATSDTPGAQQQAVELGLKRAQAIATALIHDHKIPPDKILLSATAFGRDATVKDLPGAPTTEAPTTDRSHNGKPAARL